MPTIPELKVQIDADVTDKIAINSISPHDVGDNMTAICDEIRDRGYKLVANTAALATLESADTKLALVEGIGFFKDSATGPADGARIFAGVGGRFWILTFLISPLRFSLNADGTAVVPAGRLLETILVRPDGGNVTLKIGTTAGGDEIMMEDTINDGDDVVINFMLVARAATSIHFTGVTTDLEILFFIKLL